MELSEEVEEDGVMSYKNKYRQLKSRLKYLIYVSILSLRVQIQSNFIFFFSFRSTNVSKMIFRKPKQSFSNSHVIKGQSMLVYVKLAIDLPTIVVLSFCLPSSFLLDQLMRYEAVVLSGGEETDYSSEDDSTIHPPSTADNQV